MERLEKHSETGEKTVTGQVRVGAVIAAAGAPGGFRSYDAMEHIDGSSMIRRMIFSFRRAGVEDIAVVTGYRAEETEKKLAKLGAVFLRTETYETEQMIESAVRGFTYLENTCNRIFFCPSDVPLFTEDTLKRMLEQDSPAVIPVYEGRKGHPILISAGLTGIIASYRGGRGLKGAIDAAGVRVGLVRVEDEGVLIRAGREERFEEVAETECPPSVYPRVKVQLVKNIPFFGPGMMVLLKQIEILGSVRQACEKAGMSYSKGWSLIRTAEKELGRTIVERSPGGKNGGIARVSGAGRILMAKYERLERETAEAAEKKYREIFGEIL